MSVLSHGIIKTSALGSVIAENSILSPKGERHKREVHAELLLTALIDAFSILVIFLLMSFSSSPEILMTGKIELPKAAMGEQLDRQPVVRTEEGRLYVEEKEVPQDQLVAALLDLRKKFAATHPGEEFPGIITIQGDRRLKYEALSSIVQASSQAGFSDIKFAVIAK